MLDFESLANTQKVKVINNVPSNTVVPPATRSFDNQEADQNQVAAPDNNNALDFEQVATKVQAPKLSTEAPVDTSKMSSLEFAANELNNPTTPFDKALKAGSSFFEGTGKLFGTGVLATGALMASKSKDVQQMNESATQLNEIDQRAIQQARALYALGDTEKAKRLLEVVQSHGANLTLEDIIPEGAKENVRQVVAHAGQSALELSMLASGGLFARGAVKAGEIAANAAKTASVAKKLSTGQKLLTLASKVGKAGAEVGAYSAGFGATEALGEKNLDFNNVLEKTGYGAAGGFALGATLAAGGLFAGKVIDTYVNRRAGAEKLARNVVEDVLNRTERAKRTEEAMGKDAVKTILLNKATGTKPEMFETLREKSLQKGQQIQQLIQNSQHVNETTDLNVLRKKTLDKVNTILDEEGNKINRTEFRSYINGINDAFDNVIDSYKTIDPKTGREIVKTKLNQDELTALKQDFWEKSYTPGEEIKNEAKQLAGNVIKDSVEKTLKDVPQLGQLNKDLGELIHARKVIFKQMDKPVKKKLATWLLPFATMIMRGATTAAGGATGGVGGAIAGYAGGTVAKEVVDKTLNSPTWRMKIADYLARYAQIPNPAEDRVLKAMEEQIRQKLIQENKLYLQAPEEYLRLPKPPGAQQINVLPAGTESIQLAGRQSRVKTPPVIEIPESKAILEKAVEQLKAGEVKASEIKNTVTGLKEAQKQYVKDWLGTTEEGYNFMAKHETATEMASHNEVKLNNDVVAGIKQSPFYKKEGVVSDSMGDGWLMDNAAGRNIIVPAKEVPDYLDKGYSKRIEVDSLALEAGYDNGIDYLNDQLDISNGSKITRLDAAAHQELLKTDPNYKNLHDTIGNLSGEVKNWQTEKAPLEQRKELLAKQAPQQAFGAIAGVEPYQDEDGKWHVRYDPKKGALGMGLMTLGNSKAAKEISEQIMKEAKKYKSVEEFISKYKGSATQYSDYTPEIRKFGIGKDSFRITEKGVNPEQKVTIYRGVPDTKSKIVDGDFVTVDRQSAESYAGKNNVISKEVKAKDLIYDDPSNFDPKDPFFTGAEFVYSDSKNPVIHLTESELTNLWTKANSAENVNKELTTKVLSKLEGRDTVSKQFISDLTNSGELKQVERDIIREALATETGKEVDVPKFVEKVQAELLPLKVKQSGVVTGNGTNVDARYEHIALPEELRGKVANYEEKIYESPIKTSAGNTHFGDESKNYFGHTRVEDMADMKPVSGNLERLLKGEPLPMNQVEAGKKGFKTGGTRRVIEVQSDLYQKENLSRESTMRYRGKSFQDVYTKALKEGKSADEADLLATNLVVRPREKEIAKLQQYNDPTAHFRMVREEIKQAAADGKTALQFPTGETAMKIEGLGERNNWASDPSGGAYKIDEEWIKHNGVGAEIYDGGDLWYVTKVLGDGKFQAINATNFPDSVYALKPDDFAKPARGSNDWATLQTAKNDIKNFSETFDISGKVDTNNPIYKFYEKDLGKYVQNKFGAKRITDDKGVSWYEVPIKKEWAKLPVEAFGLLPLAGLKQQEESKQK